jgi:hypothetical protein
MPLENFIEESGTQAAALKAWRDVEMIHPPGRPHREAPDVLVLPVAACHQRLLTFDRGSEEREVFVRGMQRGKEWQRSCERLAVDDGDA